MACRVLSLAWRLAPRAFGVDGQTRAGSGRPTAASLDGQASGNRLDGQTERHKSMKTTELLRTVCLMRVRYCRLASGEWFIRPQSDEEARRVCIGLLDSGRVLHAREGWQFLRAIGRVQHVFVLKLRRSSLRILSPAIAPNGQFHPLPSEQF